MSITTYWCQIFVLPKKVIKAVNIVELSYGTIIVKIQSSRMSFCTPKKEGGLRIRNLELCNRAAIGKIVWHLSICMNLYGFIGFMMCTLRVVDG